jgi:putative acyl-CoA dehydrogenase
VTRTCSPSTRRCSAELARRLPADLHAEALRRCAAIGAATTSELPALARQAEAQPPQHVPYDPWGRRVDEIRTSPAWEALRVFSARHALVATGYEAALGEHRRTVQAALLHVFSASSATYSCPLAMTDAAARVLLDLAPAGLRERLVAGLTATDPARFITSGQWMTERTGGSDVGGTETIARPAGVGSDGPRYTLHGVKWFTSATTSEMALTLARIDDGGAPGAGLARAVAVLRRDRPRAGARVAGHRRQSPQGQARYEGAADRGADARGRARGRCSARRAAGSPTSPGC